MDSPLKFPQVATHPLSRRLFLRSHRSDCGCQLSGAISHMVKILFILLRVSSSFSLDDNHIV